MQSKQNWAYRFLLLLFCLGCTCFAWAQGPNIPQFQIQNTGISGLWVLANISFAGMRAQNNQNILWRTLSFLFGFPGTIVTFFAVEEGEDRAYGVDLPRRSRTRLIG